MKRAVLSPEFTVPSLETLPPRWPGRTVELDGTATFVRDTPATSAEAEPALYVHGLGGSSSNWTDLAKLLSDHLDGQAIDLPGFGHSGPARSYTIAAMAERVIRWIEQLTGSSIANGDARSAMVRATLAAVNRRLEGLLP